MKNLEIRMLISENGLRYKDVAKELRISREWLSRLMRKDLSVANKIRIMAAVDVLIDNKRRKHGGDVMHE